MPIPHVLTRSNISLLLEDYINLPRRLRYNKSREIMRAVLSSMASALHRGESVHIKGFGIFRPVTRTPKRTGNNFITQKDRSPVPISYTPRTSVIFKPSQQLLAMLNHSGPTTYEERRSMSIWNKA